MRCEDEHACGAPAAHFESLNLKTSGATSVLVAELSSPPSVPIIFLNQHNNSTKKRKTEHVIIFLSPRKMILFPDRIYCENRERRNVWGICARECDG